MRALEWQARAELREHEQRLERLRADINARLQTVADAVAKLDREEAEDDLKTKRILSGEVEA